MDITGLENTTLFRGMDGGEIEEAAKALSAAVRRYAKGEIILGAGSVTARMGIVTDGSVTVETNDIWGNRTILSHVGCGQCFA